MSLKYNKTGNCEKIRNENLASILPHSQLYKIREKENRIEKYGEKVK